MKRLWIGDAAFCACDLDNPGLMREIGIDGLSFSRRRAGGRWVEGPPEQIAKLRQEAKDRADMNGPEGFEDGLAALRSLRSFVRRTQVT